jgi:NAD(P)-dependent dehydrogenase (short-subunit alcohol dehydrogenase family)
MAADKERTALVTGATDGVGRVVARELAKQGWRVLVHGRDRGREALVQEIEKAGGNAISWLPILRRWPRCAAWRMRCARRRTGSTS